jgi:hypothetical protein
VAMNNPVNPYSPPKRGGHTGHRAALTSSIRWLDEGSHVHMSSLISRTLRDFCDIVRSHGGKLSIATLSDLHETYRLPPTFEPTTINSRKRKRTPKSVSFVEEGVYREIFWTVEEIAAAAQLIEKFLRDASPGTSYASGKDVVRAMGMTYELWRTLRTAEEPAPLDFSAHYSSRAQIMLHRARAITDTDRPMAKRLYRAAIHMLRRTIAPLDLQLALEVLDEGLLDPPSANSSPVLTSTPVSPLDVMAAISTVILCVRASLNIYFASYEIDDLTTDKKLSLARREASVLARDPVLHIATSHCANWMKDPRVAIYMADAIGLGKGNVKVGADLFELALDLDRKPLSQNFDVFYWHPDWLTHPVSSSAYMSDIAREVNRRRKQP